jgi:hypothetical protein
MFGIKKQQQKKKKGEERKRQFGDYRWVVEFIAWRWTWSKAYHLRHAVVSMSPCRFDFLKGCKHELTPKDTATSSSSSCPFCRLVNQSIRKYFVSEAEQQQLSRAESNSKRAVMRYVLLESWARNQSRFIQDVTVDCIAEITMSGPIVAALTNEVEDKLEFSEFEKTLGVLARRKRIIEVGHYAATFIQTRVRRYCAKRKTRKALLERFEYVAPQGKKEAYYIDRLQMKKRSSYPRLIAGERPASPSTIQRRLNGDEKRRSERMKRYELSLERLPCEYEDLWLQEEAFVSQSQQLVVLRDTAAVAMRNLNHLWHGVSKATALALGRSDGRTALVASTWGRSIVTEVRR